MHPTTQDRLLIGDESAFLMMYATWKCYWVLWPSCTLAFFALIRRYARDQVVFRNNHRFDDLYLYLNIIVIIPNFINGHDNYYFVHPYSIPEPETVQRFRSPSECKFKMAINTIVYFIQYWTAHCATLIETGIIYIIFLHVQNNVS